MKKKIIFVICTIVILCVGSLVSAATTLTDIKNTKYEDSVNTLITLGLVNGYPEDNTYRPDNTVTRAEMAKLMVVALGEEGRVENAAKNQTKFKDMNGHWAYGYVNLAAELGVINGYPNGTFGPNDTVSYAEATAMVLRALEYEEEVSKSTEVWPNNYINQAKKLSLYNSVGTINSNDAAKRGNIAIMLWNMLRTGICTPIGQNANGLIYGEGEKMINKKLTGFVYLEDAMVSDIDFDDDFKEADVKIKGDKTITIEMEAREAAKMYGQKVDILYNTTKEEIELLEMTDEATIREGEIEKIKSSKIYIDGGSSSGYSLPDDDNILLYGIEDLDEAVSAILVFDGSKLEYVIAFPPEDIYLALVTDNDVTVSKEDGIKVVNYKTSSAKSYALADDEDVPEIDDIILYYLNSDNELVILDSANVFDSKEIEKVTTSSSKLEFGDTTYKYSSNTDTIAKLSSNTLKAMSLSSIEEDEDSAVLLKFANERYFVIFVGGVGQAEEDLEEDIEKAIKTLSTYMTKNTTKNAITNEVKYTQSTFATFMNAYEDAETAIADAEKKASTTNLNKVNLAYEDLQEAYKGLKLITSLSSSSRDTEKEKVELKVALRRIVNGTTSVDGKKVTTCVTNKANYTTASYNTFNTALTAAKTQLAKTNATKSNLEKVKGNLEAAIKGLV